MSASLELAMKAGVDLRQSRSNYRSLRQVKEALDGQKQALVAVLGKLHILVAFISGRKK